MGIDAAKQEIREEIEKAFAEIDLDGMTAAQFLDQLDLKPLRRFLMQNYSHPGGRGRSPKHRPLAQAKTLIFMKLVGIEYRSRVLKRLRRNIKEAEQLGYDVGVGVPSPQSFYHFVNVRVDEHVLTLIGHAVDTIREQCREQDRLIDIELLVEEGAGEGKSESTRYRKKNEKLQEATNALKWHVLPHIGFDRADNAKYSREDLLNLLTFVAMRNTFTNNGWNILRDMTDADVPRAQTLLRHIRENMTREEIEEMFRDANGDILDVAKEKGQLDGEVTVLLDYTKIRYYGDENDAMVRQTKSDDGTSKVYEYIVAKAKHNGENYILGVEPIGKLDERVERTRKLLERVTDRVRVKRVVSDREFSNSEYIQVYEDMGLTYLNVAVQHGPIKRIIEEHDAPSVVSHEIAGVKTKVVLREDSEGKTRAFITNEPNLFAFAADMFLHYGRRWDIETGFDDVKNKFLPRTTSKNYKVRYFYFLFANLVYNTWTLVNVVVMLHLDGELRDEKIVTGKKFLQALFDAIVDYG